MSPRRGLGHDWGGTIVQYESSAECMRCGDAFTDIISELRDALKDIWTWGVSVPPGMTQEEYNTLALRDIKRHAFAADDASYCTPYPEGSG